MPNTSSPNRAQGIVPSKNPNIRSRRSAKYADLRNELTRLHAELTDETMMAVDKSAPSEVSHMVGTRIDQMLQKLFKFAVLDAK